MDSTQDFEKWAKGFSGCDGGNLSGSVWFCGIEWGAGEQHDLEKEVIESVSEPPQIYDTPDVILKYPYGIKLLKLITAMRGNAVSDYLNVADETPFPFHRDSDSFKLNLFPVAFKNVDPRLWVEKYSAITGIRTIEAYLEWCRKNRFPAIRSWMQRGEPKLVVGVGRSNESDFRMAFGFNGRENVETIEGLKLVWLSNGKSILSVIPFLGYQRNLLNSDRLLQAFGKRLGGFLNDQMS
jgi:hypothetical protein